MTKTLPCGRKVLSSEGTAQATEPLLREAIARLQAYCENKGLRRSRVREQILETIVAESQHFRPADLLERLKKNAPEIGQATLYRSIPILVESGVLQKGPTDEGGQIFYELAGGDHHDHIVCLDCGHIVEFHSDEIEKIQDQIAADEDFTPQRHSHVIYAKCSLAEKSLESNRGT